MAEVTVLLRLSLEEARAYWRIAGRVLGEGEAYRKALDEESQETIDAAERAHDRLREHLEHLEQLEGDGE